MPVSRQAVIYCTKIADAPVAQIKQMADSQLCRIQPVEDNSRQIAHLALNAVVLPAEGIYQELGYTKFNHSPWLLRQELTVTLGEGDEALPEVPGEILRQQKRTHQWQLLIRNAPGGFAAGPIADQEGK